MPNRPTKRSPHSVPDTVVDTMSTTPERFDQVDRQPPAWDSRRYHARPSISRVRPRSGHVSTRNAGARASPADVPATTPSRPGTTHHQGRGKSPLSNDTKGASTFSNLIMFLLTTNDCAAAHRRPKDASINSSTCSVSFDSLRIPVLLRWTWPSEVMKSVEGRSPLSDRAR